MKFNKQILVVLMLGAGLISSSNAEEINNSANDNGLQGRKFLSYMITFDETTWNNLNPLRYKLNGRVANPSRDDTKKYKAEYIKTDPWSRSGDQLAITSTDYTENEFQIVTNTDSCSLSSATKLPINFITTEVRANGDTCIIKLKN